MQHLWCTSKVTFLWRLQHHVKPGKVFALHRIKEHAPLLVRPRQFFLSFSLAAALQAGHLSRWLRHGQIDLPTPSVHRLPVTRYLILFCSSSFSRLSVRCGSSKPPSLLVFLRISAHFTATLGIPLASTSPSSLAVSIARPGLSPGFHDRLTEPPTRSLRPHLTTLAPTYYRGCWHVVSRGFLEGYRQASRLLTLALRPQQQCFTTRRPSSH